MTIEEQEVEIKEWEEKIKRQREELQKLKVLAGKLLVDLEKEKENMKGDVVMAGTGET